MGARSSGDDMLPAGDLRPEGSSRLSAVSGSSENRPSMVEGNSRGSYFQGDVNPNELETMGPHRAPVPVDDVSDIIDAADTMKQHYTDEFEEKFLIVRRGFWVHLTVDDFHAISLFKNRNYHARRIAEDVPSKAQREVHLNVNTDRGGEYSGWELDAEKRRFKIPPNAIIGEWRFFINRRGPYRLFILFNPWCEEDPVFMPDQNMAEEYVLEEGGYLYTGTKSKRGWFYGQFETGILEIVLHLLDRTSIVHSLKASPIHVARSMSAAINANDSDDGLIHGRWKGSYSGGRHPCSWTNSVNIFQKFAEKGRPVKYGQCWVFAACMNTALRCLGIPSRVVTCTGCFHDENKNVVKDYYYDAGLSPVRKKEWEGMWNFHVWNEVWMRRRDLGEAYDGWQVIDATPQEKSDGLSQLGPASLRAIKEGHCYLPYDAAFVFAEVNADKAYWVQDNSGKFQLYKIKNSSGIGTHLYTDQDGQRIDMMDQYKFKEGSVEERQQTLLAVSCGTRPSIYDEVPNKDLVEITSDLPEEYHAHNDLRFQIFFKFKEEDDNGDVIARVTCCVTTYHGVLIQELLSDKQKLELPGGSPYQGVIPAREVQQHLNGENVLRFHVFCYTPKNRDMSGEQFIVQLESCEPTLEVRTEGPFKKGQGLELVMNFENEYEFPLSKCAFKLDAPWLKDNKPFVLRNLINPRESKHIRVQYVPRKRGVIVIVGSFLCDELKTKSVTVKIRVD